jgi:outer membrane lipoprotein SlyB
MTNIDMNVELIADELELVSGGGKFGYYVGAYVGGIVGSVVGGIAGTVAGTVTGGSLGSALEDHVNSTRD